MSNNSKWWLAGWVLAVLAIVGSLTLWIADKIDVNDQSVQLWAAFFLAVVGLLLHDVSASNKTRTSKRGWFVLGYIATLAYLTLVVLISSKYAASPTAATAVISAPIALAIVAAYLRFPGNEICRSDTGVVDADDDEREAIKSIMIKYWR